MHYLFSRYVSRALLLIATTGAGLSSAIAQPSGAQGNDFLYRTVQNDTLIHLAAKFTSDEQNWRILQSLNNVAEPKALPIGKLLHIPFHLIPQLPDNAVVTHVSGEVWLDQKPLQAGDSIPEGSAIRTGNAGFATLRLSDDSTVTIPASAKVSIERLRVFQNTPLIDTIITIDTGSLESTVAPKKTGVGRFEVRTPVSITGVRGTKLRVHSSSNGARSEVLEGAAQLDAGQNFVNLKSNQGAAVDTSGQLLKVSTLLAAPQLPEISPADHSGRLSFPAITGANSYLVRIAADPEGQLLLASHATDAPLAVYSRSAKDQYLLVRAIDANGIGGRDAITAIPAGNVLLSSDGTPVQSRYADTIRLTNY